MKVLIITSGKNPEESKKDSQYIIDILDKKGITYIATSTLKEQNNKPSNVFNDIKMSDAIIAMPSINEIDIGGFVNIARKINGVQIGFINYSDTVEKGIPIGFLSIVKKGYHAFEIGTDETMHLNGSFKTGVNQFYNIFTIGTKINGNQFLWGWGYGIGSMVQLNERFGVNIDLVSYNFRVDEWKNEKFNLVNKAKLNLSFRLSDNISVYGGVSYNVFVSNQKTDEGNFTDSGLVPWANYSEIKHNTLVKMYAGANAGLSISF